MRSTFYIALFCVASIACNKQNPNINLTGHTEQKIVGEGFFTDSLMKHQFVFTTSNNLGTAELNYANAVDLSINTPERVQHYSRIGEGIFESDSVFKGNYGENYTIKIIYKGEIHEIETLMPSPIAINEVYYQEFDTINDFFEPGVISMNISSPVEQYMRFALLVAGTNDSGDTTWTETRMPVYRVAKINPGDSLTTRLPIEDYDSFFINKNSLIKIRTSIISKDVGEYLLRLKNYVQNELLNNQSYNAPFYYSNEAYGLGYGTILDSIVHQYE